MSETFVDSQRVEMAPRPSWPTLSLNALLETKNQILDKIFIARGNQGYLKPLNEALCQLDALIAAKMNDPRGAN